MRNDEILKKLIMDCVRSSNILIGYYQAKYEQEPENECTITVLEDQESYKDK